MAHLTPDQFSAKWIPLLANNVFQDIDGVRLGQLITDIKDSFAASLATANVPDWLKGTYYPQDYLILHPFGGPAIFMKALQAGYLPVPTDPLGDVNWEPVLGPVVAGTYQVGTVPALRHSKGDWVPGRLYILLNRLDAQGDPLPDVYVRALSASELEPAGYTIDAQGTPPEPQPVAYDLSADETQPLTTREPPVTILNTNQLYTYDTLAAAAASGKAEFSALTITGPVPADAVYFSTVGTLNGNGNTLAGLSDTDRFGMSVGTASDTSFVLGAIGFSEAYKCQITNCIVYGGRLIDCLIKTDNKFNGNVTLEGSTSVPPGFFSAFTRNADGTYTTPDGGTITDLRVSVDAYTKAESDARFAPLAHVGVGQGRTVTFDQERHWPTITTGTYVLDAAGAVVDVCFQLVLAVGCTEISVPATGFVKLSNATFDATRTNYYSFLVGVDGLIQYYLRQVAL